MISSIAHEPDASMSAPKKGADAGGTSLKDGSMLSSNLSSHFSAEPIQTKEQARNVFEFVENLSSAIWKLYENEILDDWQDSKHSHINRTMKSATKHHHSEDNLPF